MHVSETRACETVRCLEVEVAARHFTANAAVRVLGTRFRELRFAKSPLTSAMADEPASLLTFHRAQLRISLPKMLVIYSKLRELPQLQRCSMGRPSARLCATAGRSAQYQFFGFQVRR